MKYRALFLGLSLAVLLPLASLRSFGQSIYEPYTFSTLAGLATIGYRDGSLENARFNEPRGIAVDTNDDIYVADTANHIIRKITQAGVVSTLAGTAGTPGSADGTGNNARFNRPNKLAVDSTGNVYVTDRLNHTVRKVTSTGVVTTLAGSAGNTGSTDGTGSAARFNGPVGIAVDGAGNVYVTEDQNHTIRKITPAGVVTTIAGTVGVAGSADGTRTNASFNGPYGIAVDTSGNIYISDTGNHTIRKITPAGIVSTLAGTAGSTGNVDGSGSAARFNTPLGISVDSAGNVYVADSVNYTIRKVDPTGEVTTLAGSAGVADFVDGTGSDATFDSPQAVAVDETGYVFVADTFNHAVRMVSPAAEVITITGGGFGNADGKGDVARFDFPAGVALDAAGTLYVTDTDNNTIRKITPAGDVTTFVGSSGNYGSADGTGDVARFDLPFGLTVDTNGVIFVADANNGTIRKVTPAGVVTTLAGSAGVFGSLDGTGGAAKFDVPVSLAVDSSGNLYVADYFNDTIRKVTAAGVVTTLAGFAGVAGDVDGTGRTARFNGPSAVAVDSAGIIYVAQDSHTVRKVSPSGVVTTFAGKAGEIGFADGAGASARFYAPRGLAVDAAGNVFVADNANTIRKITPTGVVTTVAGVPGKTGSADGSGSSALFWRPRGIAVNKTGTLYVADASNDTIRAGSVALSILSSGNGFGFNAGQFGFSISGSVGSSIVVDASTDLQTWIPVWTNTLGSGTAPFTDPQSGVFPRRFYRARTQ